MTMPAGPRDGSMPDRAAGALVWIRSGLFNLCFFGVSAVIVLLALPTLLLPRPAVLWMMRQWAWVVVGLLRWICGIRLRILGAENLPPPGAPALIAAKHQSAFDTILWLGILDAPAYVLKRELLRIPGYGRLATHAGMIAVDRAAGASAMRHLLRSGQEAAAAGRQIVIFPEGTRVAPGERAPYQPGVAALATATRLPVIPAAIDSGLRWGRRAFRKRPGTITLSILPPLPADLPRAALLDRLAREIETETNRLMQRDAPVDEFVDRPLQDQTCEVEPGGGACRDPAAARPVSPRAGPPATS